jgi:hypothetical protein
MKIAAKLAICFSFPKHYLGCKAGSENLYPESPLLCKDIVPLVVTELPFLSPLRKVIGEAA